MKLAKSLLLGSAATLVATAGAYAADLPSKKAAPVNYVKVCDAYGAGFFYIPGTDTCIKVGGRVRADFAMSGKKDVYGASYSYSQGSTVYTTNSTSTSTSSTTGNVGNYVTTTNTTTTSNTSASIATTLYLPTQTTNGGNALASAAKTQNLYGWEARGRVDLDARTATGYGTVQTVASLRLARTTGILDQTGPALSSTGAGATLEAAYIRFAGFTFGVAKDNFSFMPSTFYGAGHWSSFANGAKQIAYTAVLGGGFSATIAVQDATDTTAGGQTVGSFLATVTGAQSGGKNLDGLKVTAGQFASQSSSSSTVLGSTYSYNSIPQINGRIDFDQAWGSASVMGAVGKAVADNSQNTIAQDKTVYAVGAGLKVNLPALAAGDVLWLNAAYANGMTEYTTNWTSFKSSDTKRNVGGSVLNHPSWVVNYTGDGMTAEIQTLKSWDVAAIFTHFWSPQWRHSFLASYGAVNGTDASKKLVFGQAGAFGDAKVWNLGTQLAFLPTKDFEIGVDVLYARVQQDIRSFTSAGIAAATAAGTGSSAGSSLNAALNAGLNTTGGTAVAKESKGNWTGRLRVERTF